MNRNKRRILVLSDLKENANDTLSYAINLSKEINGALELLCIKKPSEVVTTDNQFSAMRNVSKSFIKTEKKAKNIINSITKNNFYPVKITIEFGNVKNEIENYINDFKPDFIVIGKKQKKIFNFNGDNATNFLQHNYTEKVCIANETNLSEIYDKLISDINRSQTA